MSTTPAIPVVPRALHTVREAQHILSISHAQLYRLLAAQRLSAVKIGARTFIPAASVEAFLGALPPAPIRPSA